MEPELQARRCPFCASALDLAGRCTICNHHVDATHDLPAREISKTDPIAARLGTVASMMIDAYSGSGEQPPSVVLRTPPGEAFVSLSTASPIGVEAREGQRYQILDVLGEGGMGRVYLAEDLDLKRRVALKTVLDGRNKQRFIEEAQVLAQLDHPNILPLHDLSSTDSKPYCTMRLVRGQTVQDVIAALQCRDAAALKRYTISRLMQVFMQVCQAMDYAHARGVVHRDLKPGNIMLGPHGEVQVLDWGLAQVLNLDSEQGATRVGKSGAAALAGTPSYMSPEQALSQEVDARSDVFSLGVILYELLTLERPFRGSNLVEILGNVTRGTPEPMRRPTTGRLVPARLEEICLRALEKKPAARWPTAGMLAEAIQSWLDEESDRARRHELAEERAAEAESRQRELHQQEQEIVGLRAAAVAAVASVELWWPIEQKVAVVAAEDAVRAAEKRLDALAGDVVEAATKAIEHEPENVRGRQVLADYYFQRFCEAEASTDNRGADRLHRLVERYHDGRYARELRGDGSLTLATDPPGADVSIYELVEDGYLVVERNRRDLGQTPLAPISLAIGSYLVILRKEGYRDTRYPVFISRNRDWVGTVKLYTEAEIGAQLVYIPAGPFVMGGDPSSTSSHPRSEPTLPSFAIAVHPVTCAEYLLYLNSIVERDGLDAALARAQRTQYNDPRTSILNIVDGKLVQPEVDAEGDRPVPLWPVSSVSVFDAEVYCAWLSARDGCQYRLLTEAEWEKAARGVDGRWFPWGWRFDPSLCNMRQSRRPSPVEVSANPRDLSVYGVRGLGGNMRAWTSTLVAEGDGENRRVSHVGRGGSWGDLPRACRAANRNWHPSEWCYGGLGIRVAKTLV